MLDVVKLKDLCRCINGGRWTLWQNILASILWWTGMFYDPIDGGLQIWPHVGRLIYRSSTCYGSELWVEWVDGWQRSPLTWCWPHVEWKAELWRLCYNHSVTAGHFSASPIILSWRQRSLFQVTYVIFYIQLNRLL